MELEHGTTHTLGRSVSSPSTGNRQESALNERMSIVDDADGQHGFRFCLGSFLCLFQPPINPRSAKMILIVTLEEVRDFDNMVFIQFRTLVASTQAISSLLDQ